MGGGVRSEDAPADTSDTKLKQALSKAVQYSPGTVGTLAESK